MPEYRPKSKTLAHFIDVGTTGKVGTRPTPLYERRLNARGLQAGALAGGAAGAGLLGPERGEDFEAELAAEDLLALG